MAMTELDKQVEAVLRNRSFDYMRERFGLKESKPLPWREIFTVDRAAVKAWLAQHNEQIEQYGENYSLSLENETTLRYYHWDDKFGPQEWTKKYDTLEEARDAMIDEMLHHTHGRLEFSFKEWPKPQLFKDKWWNLW
jgi:hypothetical protein